MDDKDFNLYVKNAKEKYKLIGYVVSPALNNDMVYFLASGFNHLIRKGKMLRKKSEQICRINLMPQAVNIIAH